MRQCQVMRLWVPVEEASDEISYQDSEHTTSAVQLESLVQLVAGGSGRQSFLNQYTGQLATNTAIVIETLKDRGISQTNEDIAKNATSEIKHMQACSITPLLQ